MVVIVIILTNEKGCCEHAVNNRIPFQA